MIVTSPQQIDTWLLSPSEHQRLEFKEAKTQFDNTKLYRYCVAIANEGGGHLQVGFKRTIVVVFGPRAFRKMDRADRIRACYQHCVLQWVQRQPMSNQSLRERFHLSESSSNTISGILTATTDAKLIKPDPAAPSGKKFARYLPIWA